MLPVERAAGHLRLVVARPEVDDALRMAELQASSLVQCLAHRWDAVGLDDEVISALLPVAAACTRWLAEAARRAAAS